MTVSFCLDTSIWIKYFCPDEQEEAATNLVVNTLNNRLVSPCFAWAEIASVLRKKVRANLLTSNESGQIYRAFCDFPIDYLDGDEIRSRAWEIAEKYQLLTLYDSVFLAVAEKGSAQYWTADLALLKALVPQPNYVYALADVSA